MVAALGLVQEALPLLRAAPAGAVVAVSSDAAAEAYETWGGYGASKAALDHLAAVLGVEEPGLRVWAVDPGTWARTCTRRPYRTTAMRGRRRTAWFRPFCGCWTNALPVAATALRRCWKCDDDDRAGSGGAVGAGAGRAARARAGPGLRAAARVVRYGGVASCVRGAAAAAAGGDLLIVNTSPTLAAAVDGWIGHARVVVHFSTRGDDGRWAVELRDPDGRAPRARAGDPRVRRYALPGTYASYWRSR